MSEGMKGLEQVVNEGMIPSSRGVIERLRLSSVRHLQRSTGINSQVRAMHYDDLRDGGSVGSEGGEGVRDSDRRDTEGREIIMGCG